MSLVPNNRWKWLPTEKSFRMQRNKSTHLLKEFSSKLIEHIPKPLSLEELNLESEISKEPYIHFLPSFIFTYIQIIFKLINGLQGVKYHQHLLEKQLMVN